MYSMYITQISSPPTTQQAKARKKKTSAISRSAIPKQIGKKQPDKSLGTTRAAVRPCHFQGEMAVTHWTDIATSQGKQSSGAFNIF